MARPGCLFNLTGLANLQFTNGREDMEADLIEGYPDGHQVAVVAKTEVGEGGKPLRGEGIAPSALVEKTEGPVEVEEGNDGGQALADHLLQQSLVVLDALLIDLLQCPLRQ